jgi:TonB-linked SusC/RagA family outer membrane protein
MTNYKLFNSTKKRYWLLCLFFILTQGFAASVYAQDIKQKTGKVSVSGTIRDIQGEPLPGVSVSVKGTTGGTVSDVDGNFSIATDPQTILVVSYIGYKTQEITVGNHTNLQIVLIEDEKTLDEVVVIGYGTAKKKDLTGAVSVIDTKELSKTSGVGTVGQALQGLATGVNVHTTGYAGGDASIEIRGTSNLSNNYPLWVVDGMITEPGMMFNTNDIESMQILKDASAAAIYGSRAANGVIIITTKKGKKGPLKIDFTITETWNVSPKYDLMNADEFKRYTDMAYNEGIKDGVYTGDLPIHWDNNTDWQKEVFQTSLVQDYNLSLSGGSDYVNYFVSGNYFKDNGIAYGNSFDKYTFRANASGHKGIFTFGETMLFAYTDQDPLVSSPYASVVTLTPTIPVYDENNLGGYGYGSEANARSFGDNPIAQEDLQPSNSKMYRGRATLWGELKLTDFLKYKLNTGIDYVFSNYSYFRKEGHWRMNSGYRDPYSYKQAITTRHELIEHTLDFNKNFGNHHIDAVAGMTYQHYYWESLAGQREKYIFMGGDYLTVLNAGQSTPTNSNSIAENAMISYLGRANYIYGDKYYLTFTVRRDGTSKLKKENRWDVFPSLSGAWRISNEKFFNIDWINDLKLRANYGVLGNAAIGHWDYVPSIRTDIIAIFGKTPTMVNGATQVEMNNTNLRWEKTKQSNFGLDASFLSQRLSVSAEYYNSTTEDILTPMIISMTTGSGGGNPYVNAASLKNTGIEISTAWKDKVGDWSYSVGANITTVKNEILDLGYGKTEFYTGESVSRIGHALGEFYLLKTDGLFRTQEDIDNYLTPGGKEIFIEGKRPQLGDLRYVDTDEDGYITVNDRQIVGNPWPDFTLALNFNLYWKNFDFSMMWYGQFGNQVIANSLRQAHSFSGISNYFHFDKGHEPWQDNPNSDFPRIIYNDTRNTRPDTDLWLEDGSYFKMKNIQLGYTFSSQMLQRVGLETARIYVTGGNLLTITKYKGGLDPDFINTNIWDRGIDSYSFPSPRSFNVGVQLSF